MPLVLDDVNTVSPSLAPPELSVLADSLMFRGQFLDLEHGPLCFTSSRTRPDLLLSETSGFISCELGVPEFLPQDDTYSEKMLPESSTRHDQPRLAIVHGDQNKVKCAWPGCLRSVKKNNLTRHVNENAPPEGQGCLCQVWKGFRAPVYVEGPVHIYQVIFRKY
ncbi:hypothetical protein BDR04DRAFT_1090540 [Suillus decipiens]|nr:hypothetical protein BDR04DRAFT_1090540 [Suillus decipiens]